MAVHECQNLQSTKRAWNKEGVAWSQKWLPYHSPKGVFGGDQRARTETEQEQSNAGEFPKTLTPSASVHWYNAYPWTRTYNSLYLSLNTFSLRPFLLVLKQISIYDQISQISFFLYNARSFEYFFFSFTNFIIYIEIWQLVIVHCDDISWSVLRVTDIVRTKMKARYYLVTLRPKGWDYIRCRGWPSGSAKRSFTHGATYIRLTFTNCCWYRLVYVCKSSPLHNRSSHQSGRVQSEQPNTPPQARFWCQRGHFIKEKKIAIHFSLYLKFVLVYHNLKTWMLYTL